MWSIINSAKIVQNDDNPCKVGVLIEDKIYELGAGGQADWDATSDENGHVLNRTHYKELAFAPIYDETVSYDYYEDWFFVGGLNTTIGELHKVSIEGGAKQEFILTEGLSYAYVHPNNGKTYTLSFSDDCRGLFISVSDSSKDSFTLCIEAIQTVYHIIPEEYLPKPVGRFYEGSNGGEVFNYDTNEASGEYSHAEGVRTTASGSYSHAEGSGTDASGSSSHAEGSSTEATGRYSHAEGSYALASGDASHAEGSNTAAIGSSSHAEGYHTEAHGEYSHVEGKYNFLTLYTISEPVVKTEALARKRTYYCDSYLFNTHLGVFKLSSYTTYTSDYSTLVEGQYFTTYTSQQKVLKRFISYDGTSVTYEEFNQVETSEYLNKYAHVVGNGTSSVRSNAHTLDWQGNAWYAGTIEGTAFIVPSSTPGSTKRFKVTVNDSGTLSVTEV